MDPYSVMNSSLDVSHLFIHERLMTKMREEGERQVMYWYF